MQVLVSNKPTPIIAGGVGPHLIINRDITNQIVIMDDESPVVGSNSAQLDIIDPLGSMALDPGRRGVWAATTTPGAVVLCIVRKGGVNWSASPALIQQQLNALGLAKDTSVNAPGYGPITLTAPGLLTKDTTLAAQTASGKTIAQDVYANRVPLSRNEAAITSGSTTALVANSSATIGPFTFDSPSYELKLTLQGNAAVAVCNGIITLKWSNSGGGSQFAQKTFTAVGSSGGHALTIIGPVRGSTLNITFQNYNGSGTPLTFNYNLIASSHLVNNDLIRTLAGMGTGPPTSQNWPGINMDLGVLMNATPSLATGANADEGMGVYNGSVQVQASTASGLNDAEIQIIAFDSGDMPNYNVIFDAFTDSHGVLNALVDLPQMECHMKVINHNAATKVVSVAATTAEQNVN